MQQTNITQNATVFPQYDEGESGTATRTRATIRIKDISRRDDWQVRDEINVYRVREYTTHYVYGAEMPPVRLANVDGALILMDGWHRLMAQEGLGRETVEATVEVLTEEEAQFEAAMANTRNGVRLTRRSEKQRVFTLYMRQSRNRVGQRGLKSYRDIAKDLGGLASKSSIENWMKKRFPKVAAQMRSGRDDNPGACAELGKRTRAERAVEKLLTHAVAEARAIPCLGKRLALLRDLPNAMLWAVPWAVDDPPKAIEINNDF